MTNEAAPLLHLLKAEPTLLPAAPNPTSGAQMEHRRRDEVHPCLRCGERATSALVAATPIGPRWVDICHKCRSWLQTNLDKDPPADYDPFVDYPSPGGGVHAG